MKPMYRTMTRVLPAFFLLALFLLMAALLLSACTWPSQPPPTPVPGETELSFESIDRYSSLPTRTNSKTQPAVVLVTSRQEIEERLDHIVRDSALKELQNVDFEQYFALAVFRGTFSTGGYMATVRQVARRGDRLVVYAEFSETPPDHSKPAVPTAPYHLVKVQRDGGPLEQQSVILLTWVTYIQ